MNEIRTEPTIFASKIDPSTVKRSTKVLKKQENEIWKFHFLDFSHPIFHCVYSSPIQPFLSSKISSFSWYANVRYKKFKLKF